MIVGLVGMGFASLGFAVADSFWTLLRRASYRDRRLVHVGGAFAWLLAAAPRERRGGALIGSAMGSAVFGALFGPVIGAAAAIVGRAAIFSALARSPSC